MTTRPSSPKKQTLSLAKIIGIAGCLLACCSLIAATLALIPAFWTMFSSRTLPDVVTNNNVRVDLYEKYVGTFVFLLPDKPSSQIDTDSLLPISASGGNIVKISVTNTSNQMITISKSLPVKIISFEPINDVVNAYTRPMGGVGYYRMFEVEIPNTSAIDTVFAHYEEFSGDGTPLNNQSPDFFTLESGETEIFKIDFKFSAPGNYKFAPGIEYSLNGTQVKIYLAEPIQTVVTNHMVVWGLASGNEYTILFECDYKYPSNNLDTDYYDPLNNSYTCQ